MASPKKSLFTVPLIDEDVNDDISSKPMSSGSLFKAHRQELQQSIKNRSPAKPSLTTESPGQQAKDQTNITNDNSAVNINKGQPVTNQSKTYISISKNNQHIDTNKLKPSESSHQASIGISGRRDFENGQSQSGTTFGGVTHSSPDKLTTARASTNHSTASAATGAVSPVKPTGSRNSLIVSARQRGNPILKHVRNVPWEYGDIVADYQLGKTSCALFLSLRYHNLNPNYIHERLKRLGHSYDLRVLLAQVDVKDPHHALKELAQICLLSDTTLILAFSAEEAGRYLETFKAYEHKPPDLIMERTESNFLSQLTDCLTSTRKVNKTDASTLLTTFGSFAEIAKRSEEDLSLCPGFGPSKAKRLHEVLNEPFLKSKKKAKRALLDEENGPKPSTSSSNIT